MKHMEAHFDKNELGQEEGGGGKKITHLTRLHQKQGFSQDASSILLISSMNYSTLIKTVFIPQKEIEIAMLLFI